MRYSPLDWANSCMRLVPKQNLNGRQFNDKSFESHGRWLAQAGDVVHIQCLPV